jgi:lactate dehydrogenase-like 2-hydroxyacid dehydrogenase
MNTYLEKELDHRFRLHRFWEPPPGPPHDEFLRAHKGSICAIVGNAAYGADTALIDALPALQIVASFSVGIDHVDLAKCRERGIRVTNTPDVLTDDVVDLAIGLAIAVRPIRPRRPLEGQGQLRTHHASASGFASSFLFLMSNPSLVVSFPAHIARSCLSILLLNMI